jgi:hypothetical protein
MTKLQFLENGAQYPKETRRVELGDYHESLAGDFIDVWVNLPRRLSDERLTLAVDAANIATVNLGDERDKQLAKLNERMMQFHSEWWGVPLEQIQQLYQIDTILYEWIALQASRLREAYSEDRKKVDESSTPT